MKSTYNIYKVKHSKLDALCEKLLAVGLIEQKTINSEHYSMKFFFSENIRGNEIWWWSTYSDFFNDGTSEPKNFFYFAVLLCTNIDNPEVVYAISLGKSHFYLSKYIELDFGINLAIRMADEDTILLKKSRYFTGSKRQDISSYERFIKNNYDSGESVEHLKLKASDRDIWGEKNIIFADSIQMDIDIVPTQLEEIFSYIATSINAEEVINLPKLEPVTDEEQLATLDHTLFQSIRQNNGDITIDEFRVYGVHICFNFHEYDYVIVYKNERTTIHRKPLGNHIEISDIHEFLIEHEDVIDLNRLKVQFQLEDTGAFTKNIKDVIDFYTEHEGFNYFLKNGEWYKFNQTFMYYLKQSLESIPTMQMTSLIENDYLQWKEEKQQRIDNNEELDDKITYREYYFNNKISIEEDFELLDRQLTHIQSIESSAKRYKVEVADLYKNNEIISVKISSMPQDLIYNIEQSKDSLELIMQKVIPFDQELHGAALWFVFEDDIRNITQVNSIQFLLAVESWHKRARFHKLNPRIYISRHIKT